MKTFAAILRAILRFAVVGVLVVVGIVGFFVAWWIVVLALLALSAYIAIRRFFGAKPSPPAGPAGTVIIEGEFEVERDGGKSVGRVIEVQQVDTAHGAIPDQFPPGTGDNNKS